MAAALPAFHARHAALRAALGAAAREDRADIVRAFGRERARQRVAWTASMVITCVFVLALAALARRATRSLTVPLRQAVDAADRVAEGDLGVTLPAAGGDEVGQLLRSMARMVGNLRRSEARLTYQAYHDALTGLANRARFRERAAEALAAAAAADRAERVAVLLLDLDGFKLVNDSAGHAAGDELLREVAARLLDATRGSDLVARLGGDEFAILLANVGGDADVARVAERVIAALSRSVAVRGTTAVVGASVGVARGGAAFAPDPAGAAGAAAPVDALLRAADLALYTAKARGRGALRRVRAGDARRGGRAAGARGRPARRARAGRVPPRLPADRRPRLRRAQRRRGARAVAASVARAGCRRRSSSRWPRRRGSSAVRPLGAGGGVPAGRGVGGRRRAGVLGDR
jgi:diguanylate cyclase (GGDEF)-like protein